MPEPIEYRIVRNLQEALKTITEAGGYHYTVEGTAVKLDPNHEVDALIASGGPRPFVLLAIGDERWDFFPGLQIRLIIPVAIYWVGDFDPSLDESMLQTYFRGCADVERAIAIDVSRGGLAVDTRIVKRTLDRSIDGTQVWALVDTEVWITRAYGQPDS